jgi:dipeptidyl aminopeptidase/acylaminoacyl peptidase
MTQKRALEAKDLYRLRLISDPQISPDGSRIAFVLKQMDEEKNDYRSNIYVVDRDGTVVQFTSGDKDWGPRWSPDGKYLAFVSDRKEKAQVHLLSTRGGESLPVTNLKLGAGLPIWSPDSTAIVFTGVVPIEPEEEERKEEKAEDKKTARTRTMDRTQYKLDGAGFIGDRRRHLFLIDVATRTVEQLTDGDYHDDNASWSPDSRHIAFSSSRSPRWDVSLESDIYVMPRSGGEARAITSGGAYGRPAFSPDGSRIAFYGHEHLDDIWAPARIYSANASGSDLRDELGEWDGGLANEVVSDVVLSAEQLNVVLVWRPDGIYFLGTEHGECNLYRTDGTVHPVTHGKNTLVDFSIAEDGTVAFGSADSTHLVEVFVSTESGGEQLTHENDAFLEEVLITPPQRLSFVGARGERSEGWLIPPRGHESGKYPLIVYIHGGPMLAHGEALHYEYQFLAGQGFGVFYPNLHGSSSYGCAYQTSIKEDWGNLDYQDVLAGASEAASHPWVDPERLGIAGGSYGGFMTNWVVTHDHRFRAAVTERCLSNILSFYGTSDTGWTWSRMWGVYPEEDVQKLWDMSPIKYVAHVTTPVLVVHSEGDDRTPLEQGEQMFNALRRLGKETRFVVFPEESHGLSRIGKPSRRVERLGYILEWFRQYL